MKNTIGVVLAGGLSRRFGSPKAFAQLQNKYFYEYAVEALNPHCDKVIVVTRPELAERFPKGIEIMTDIKPFMGLGPLAGIYSAMEVKNAESYIILPCDMPFITEGVIEKLIEQPNEEVIAVKMNEYHYPLVSLWNRSVKDKLQQSLEQRRLGVMLFLKDVRTLWIHGDTLTNDPNKIFKNINREIDLERGEENECNG